MAKRKRRTLAERLKASNTQAHPGYLVWRTEVDDAREQRLEAQVDESLVLARSSLALLRSAQDGTKEALEIAQEAVTERAKFTGRDKGTFGPLKAMLRAEMLKLKSQGASHRQLTAKPLWYHLKSHGPKDWDFGGDAGNAKAEVWSTKHKQRWPYRDYEKRVSELITSLGLRPQKSTPTSKRPRR